jgi:molecular chaperone DnaK (HSP70)
MCCCYGVYTQARSGIVAVLDIGGRGMTCSLIDVQSGTDTAATPWGTVVASERCDTVGGEYIEELLVTEVSSHNFNSNYSYCESNSAPLYWSLHYVCVVAVYTM